MRAFLIVAVSVVLMLELAAACAPLPTTPCTRCVQPKTATRCKIAGHDDWTCGKLIVTYSLSSDLCGVATLTCFPDFGKASFAAVGVENDEFTVPAGNGTAAATDIAFITDVQKGAAIAKITCNQNSTWIAPDEFGLGNLDKEATFYCLNFKKAP